MTPSFQRRFVLRMLLLPLLDLGVTGIFILVTQRMEVVSVALANLALFGLAAAVFAVWAYRPLRQLETTGSGSRLAAMRLEQLPVWSAAAAALLVVVFSVTASSLGVYTPVQADLDRFSQQELALALAFYAGTYAVL